MPDIRSRGAVVKLVQSWVGKKESDGSFKSIIDIYNAHIPLPRNTKMEYSWAWCACTWSALAIKLGYTDIMPIEISCYYLIEAAKKMGCWKENDGYVPRPGDAILYDWQDSGKGDNTGAPDHVGTVEYLSGGYIVVTEGNYSNAVKRRTISINGRFIRGFITPAYTDDIAPEPERVTSPTKTLNEIAHEVITGVWGNMPERKEALEKAGYDYESVRIKVNSILNEHAETPTDGEVTTTVSAGKFDVNIAGNYIVQANGGLYMRNDAGTNKRALTKLPDSTIVRCYGYYSVYNGAKWYLVKVKVGTTTYTGFCHSAYLKLQKKATVIG